MAQTIYHVGLRIGGGTVEDAQRGPATLEIHLRRNRDLLPPDIWRYEGTWLTTMQAVHAKRDKFMATINHHHQMRFTRCVVR